MTSNIKNSLMILMRTFKCSLNGLIALLEERAFRWELVLGIVFLLVELFRANNSMFIQVFSSYLLILIAEGINTAIELTHDRISREQNECARLAKDISSAVVFISLLNFVVIWGYSWVSY
jgi:Diacylglycerol kinase